MCLSVCPIYCHKTSRARTCLKTHYHNFDNEMSKCLPITFHVLMLIVFFFRCEGTCELCSYINQTTSLSNCSETCGGGESHYFQYVCCLNLTRSGCESECNKTLTFTKSVKLFESCNKICYNGGTYNETTKSCNCTEERRGRCCNQYVNRHIGKKSPYLTVGLPLGLVLLLAILVVIVYGWCMNRRRNLRVDMVNKGSIEEVQGCSNIKQTEKYRY